MKQSVLAISERVKKMFKAGGLWMVAVNPLPNPDNGMVCAWAGSSAVPIASNWLLTANTFHFPGVVIPLTAPINALCDYQNYPVVEAIPHPLHADLILLRIANSHSLPVWHRPRWSVIQGSEVLLAGWGWRYQPGQPWYNANGQQYTYREELWGTNRVLDMFGGGVRLSYSAPTDPEATVHEAAPAINDSGGGMFTRDPSGEIFLEGIMTNVTHPGDSSPYFNTNYGSMISVLGLTPYFQDWIFSHVRYERLEADWNEDGRIDHGDIYAFLASYFQHEADFNDDGSTSPDDLFAFLAAWLGGGS